MSGTISWKLSPTETSTDFLVIEGHGRGIKLGLPVSVDLMYSAVVDLGVTEWKDPEVIHET